MTVRIIVATDLHGGIGRNNALPWPRLTDDFKTFKEKTMGGTLVMGRNTYQSIPKALPGRKTIVVSRDPEFLPEGVEVHSDLEDLLTDARKSARDVWVCGGELVYEKALPFTDEIHLTTVFDNYRCDVKFPKVNLANWQMVPDEMYYATLTGLRYTISVYVRREFTR